MPLRGFDELFHAADGSKQPVSVAAAGGADATVLSALAEAASRGWVKPIITGDPEAIEQVAESIGVDLTPFRIVAADEPARAAVAEIHAGASLLMKGQVSTPDLMKAVLDREHGLRTGRTICQIVLMEIPRDGRRFLMSDTGVTIAPTKEQKIDIMKSLVDMARRLWVDEPRIAILSATEKVNQQLPDTIEADELAQAAHRGVFGSIHLEGPLSFDLAYDTAAGQKKGVTSEVVGRADAMLFPDLLSANLTVKAIMYTADCRFGGLLAGVKCPVVFMSRADDAPTRLRSLALALHAQRANGV
jgi:phosphotransacetylase